MGSACLDGIGRAVLACRSGGSVTMVWLKKREQPRYLRTPPVTQSPCRQQALELSTQLYRAGLVDFLRVLDSERSLYAAQDALSRIDQSVSLDLVQLYKALGGGWGA